MTKAIILLSIGTSNTDERKITIENIEKTFVNKFKDYDIYIAFSSDTIIKKIKEKENKDIKNQIEMLEYLKKNNYEEVIIQPLYIIKGIEYEKIKKNSIQALDWFKIFKIGDVLLENKSDYEKIIKILLNNTKYENLKNNEIFILIGHGTQNNLENSYENLEIEAKKLGYENVFVRTLKDIHKIEEIIEKISFKKIKKINLIPLMISGGYHVLKDIAGENENSWKKELEKNNINIEIEMHGIGRIKEISEIYIKNCMNLTCRTYII